MNESTNSPKKKRAGRSPSFPGIDIQTALKRAEELYDKAQHHSSHVEIVAKHWGYKQRTSLTDIIVAALIRYELLVSEGTAGTRAVRLTELALDIIKDKRPDTKERNQKISQAALNPKIHKELFKTYGFNLKSDDDVVWDLDKNMGFTPNGAKDFLSQYKRTLSFISGIKNDIIPQENGDSEEGEDDEGVNPPFVQPTKNHVKPPTPKKGGKMKNVEIPTKIRPWPVLTVPFPMSETLWEQMMTMLENMKPAIVEEETNENASTDTDDAE